MIVCTLCTELLIQENKTALLWACKNGHDKVVRALIQAGANVNSVDKVSCCSNSFSV